ncbi:MAG: 2-C-methyl-D-erythritol 4-phosphate cytidylyltransferase [Candidatus Brocadiales bacterium]|nr:2-C-methyl-D-erythritol 4-phosphate cytidylyltransferase [Candidatus Brocadiales bacterium]
MPVLSEANVSNVSVIIPSAGLGLRMGGNVRKPFLSINGKPILLHTFEKFSCFECVHEIILVVNPDDHSAVVNEWNDRLSEQKRTKIIPGGKRRQDSVYNGLLQLDANCDIVLIHDAVRPFVTKEIIEAVIKKVEEHGAAIAAVPIKDTVKQVGAYCNTPLLISRTVPRADLWMAQTPQGFKKHIIMDAYKKLLATDAEVTDDAEVAERFGYKVAIVRDSDINIKITTPEDLALAEAIAGMRSTECGG